MFQYRGKSRCCDMHFTTFSLAFVASQMYVGTSGKTLETIEYVERCWKMLDTYYHLK